MDISLPLTLAWPIRRLAALVVATAVVVLALVIALAVSNSGLRPHPNEFNIPAWELRELPGKWLFAAGELFRKPLSVDQENQKLSRFFQLTSEIDAMETDVSDAQQRGQPADEGQLASLDAKRRERDGLENRVEAILEGRVSKTIRKLNITRSLGPLGSVVWPPVDFELTRSPMTLAVSRRDRIELIDSQLLETGLNLGQVEAIENEVAKSKNVSTLAVPTGGIGAYPAIVDYPRSYQEALETVSHEWTHNYLAFRPLGIHYYASNSLRTINETVADLVGREVASSVAARWPIDPPPAPRPAPSPDTPRPTGPRLNVGAELRALRGQVDDLLAQGKIDDAESLMEQKRQELESKGYRIRKLNQAYFAFYNLYAGAGGSPVATNPIGPKIDQLRKQSPSLARFVRIVGNVTSVADLDQALVAPN